MTKRALHYISVLAIILITGSIRAQVYPDQSYIMRIDSIKAKVESSENVRLSDDGKSFLLQTNSLEGYIILREQSSQYPFNQGLPSYNGTAPGENCGFKVQMRFPEGAGWSPWLTIGYWKNNIWPDYGATSYSGGKIDIDYALINYYISKWQFKVILTRKDPASPSPTIHKLGFFVSDSRTTSNVIISQLVNDNPADYYIPTSHVYQYSVDPNKGGDMCSPSTVSMILKSYGITVDPFTFAWATYDNYHRMFGIWPRVVENASEYGLDGEVSRYRSWSEARKVLAKGGRIAMSVGKPISTVGHLLMLAGFKENGKPIVHDPGKSSGLAYVYDKTDVSTAWFTKGGIAYTFYPAGTVTSVGSSMNPIMADNFELYQNYPNPFNPSTAIRYQIRSTGYVTLKVYNMIGEEISILVNEIKAPGSYEVTFDGSNLASGVYVYRLQAGNSSMTKKLVLLK